MRAKRRMTAAEFEAVRPLLKISDDRIKARAWPLSTAKRSKPLAINSMVAANRWRCRQHRLEDLGELPRIVTQQRPTLARCCRLAGEQVTLIAPSHLITKFRRKSFQASPQPVKKTTRAKKKD